MALKFRQDLVTIFIGKWMRGGMGWEEVDSKGKRRPCFQIKPHKEMVSRPCILLRRVRRQDSWFWWFLLEWFQVYFEHFNHLLEIWKMENPRFPTQPRANSKQSQPSACLQPKKEKGGLCRQLLYKIHGSKAGHLGMGREEMDGDEALPSPNFPE